MYIIRKKTYSGLGLSGGKNKRSGFVKQRDDCFYYMNCIALSQYWTQCHLLYFGGLILLKFASLYVYVLLY